LNALKSAKLIKLETAVTLGEAMGRENLCVSTLSGSEIAKVSERKTKERYSSFAMIVPISIARAIGLKNGDALRCVAVEYDAKKGFLCVRLEQG